MSNLTNSFHFSPAFASPPLSWYFDDRIAAVEDRVLFRGGPNYVGHELMTPKVGDYCVLDWRGGGRVLVRHEGGVEWLSNVCRHRQALMLKGRGNARNIVCPVHRWTYRLDGQLMGAPHFPDAPCLDLGKYPLARWNGLLFSGERDVAADLADIAGVRELDFTGHVLDRIQVDQYSFNWKTFIEVYLEDYHVVPFHPGLGSFVECDKLQWHFGERYSIQTVGIRDHLRRPGTPVYARWHDQVLRYGNGTLPKHGAVWLTYYPNIMVEWYPGSLVISTVIPRGPEACTNVVEFYYPEEIALFEREYVEAEQAAYFETAVEDEEICTRITEGRRSLYLQGEEQQGPYQSPMEDGMLHFHEFLRRELLHHLAS